MGWKDGDKAGEIWGEGNDRGRWWTAAAGIVVTAGPGPALGHRTPPGDGCTASTAVPSSGMEKHTLSCSQVPFPLLTQCTVLIAFAHSAHVHGQHWAHSLQHQRSSGHLKELHSLISEWEKRRRKAGGGRGAPLLMFDKEPVAPEAANKASSTLSNAMQFFQEDILKKELKGHKRRWLLWGRRLQHANSSWMPPPWLSSRSSPVTQCHCRDWSSVLSASQDNGWCPFPWWNQFS